MKGKKFKKAIAPVVTLSLLIGGMTPILAQAEGASQIVFDAPKHEQTKVTFEQTKQLIIGYKNPEGKKVIFENSNEIEHQFKNIDAVTATVDEATLKELENNPNIAYIEENIRITTLGNQFKVVSDVNASNSGNGVPKEESQWDIQSMGVSDAWNEGYTGKGVKVAVIDTGIAKHKELNITGGVSTVEYTNAFYDDHGHGTHVAGSIGARRDGLGIVGVAPDVELLAVKALDQNGNGMLFDIVEGIDWAIQNNADIINLSLGTQVHSQLLEDIVNRAYQKGIIVVGASGNDGEWDGSGDTVDYPARYESVVAVGSVDSSLNRSLFSSTGQAVEFSAPGQDIVSTYLNGQYAISSGTSMASPHVAGMFALLKEKFPNKSNVELREELQNYVVDLGFKGRDTFYGYGFTKYNVKKEEKKEATFVITKPIQDQKSLMDEKQLKEKIGIAKRNVELAEKYRTPLHVDMASKAIEGLPECPEKEEFLLRIGYVIKELEAKELEKKIKSVEAQLQYAEKYQMNSFIKKAQQMIDELPNCPEKEAFQERLDAIK